MPLVDMPTVILCQVVESLGRKDYLNFRATCRTTSKIEFEAFAKKHFVIPGTMFFRRVAFPKVSKYSRATCLFRGSPELARFVKILTLDCGTSWHPPKPEPQPQVQNPFRRVMCGLTVELLPLLPCLKNLRVTDLDGSGIQGQLEFDTMLEGLVASGTNLSKITLQACTISSSQVQNIIDNVPTLGFMKLDNCISLVGWPQILRLLASQTSLSLTKLVAAARELRFVNEKDETQLWILMSLVGKHCESRHTSKTWRTSEGWQQYRLGRIQCMMSKDQGIRAGLRRFWTG